MDTQIRDARGQSGMISGSVQGALAFGIGLLVHHVIRMNVPESCGRWRPVDNEGVISNIGGSEFPMWADLRPKMFRDSTAISISFHPVPGCAPKIRFAGDSSLEGDGFEPSVPRQKISFGCPPIHLLQCKHRLPRDHQPDDLAANGRTTAIEFNWAPPKKRNIMRTYWESGERRYYR